MEEENPVSDLMFPKRQRVVKNGDEFKRFIRGILTRDGWQCRVPWCKATYFLQAHHVIKKSDLHLDTPENMITLCEYHHNQAHHHKLKIVKTGDNDYSFRSL